MGETLVQRLDRLIDAEANLLQAFVGLLQREQDALTQGDLDALQPLAADKTSGAQRLARCAQERNLLLAAAHLPMDRAGMDAFLAGRSANDPTTRRWDRLLELAAQASELNRVNGTLIQTRLQHNQQALSALLRHTDAPLGLYGPDGHSQGITGSRTLASA